MSPLKETAIKLIQEIPDDKIVYVLHIIKGINGLYKDTAASAEVKQNAFKHMQQFRGRIPPGLNYSEELAKSRADRYASIN